MANRAVLACVEALLRTIMDDERPFGGKIIILLGDFRQTCPVIPYGSKADVIEASLKSSPLWSLFTVVRLVEPIRNAEDPEFAALVDAIGDGAGPIVELPFLEHVQCAEDLIAFVYPADVLADPLQCARFSLLAPTHHQIEYYNRIVLAQIHGDANSFVSTDSLKEADEAGLDLHASILDYVALHTPPGMPPNILNIKTNGVYRLLRNLSLDQSLVKNLRLVVKSIGQHLITVRVVRPSTAGICSYDSEDLLLPRITFSTVLPSGHTLLRKQFPMAPAYATTFNSCQGLTLDRVGIDLTVPVFSHGQLYTAMSRVRHRSHCRILLPPGQTSTINVTYPEILV